MSTYEDRWIEVFTTKPHPHAEVCSLGHTHPVHIFASKLLSPVMGKRDYNNGYYAQQTDVRMDRQGRWYHQQPPTDFHGRTFWVRDDDNAHFTVVPVFTRDTVNKDVVGRTLKYHAGRVVRL